MVSPRVLIVDDEPMMIEISSDLLLAFGFDVSSTTSGEEALQLAAKERPDIVLLDVMMPGIDCRDICRRIKADPSLRDTRVVLNSSLTEGEIDWRETGADGYREKNRDLRGLPDYLRTLMGDESSASE
jgi:CheY-like chemotaxis protein